MVYEGCEWNDVPDIPIVPRRHSLPSSSVDNQDCCASSSFLSDEGKLKKKSDMAILEVTR